jgi:putative hydrolase of the HAD superfamily
MIRTTEEETMKKAPAITCVLLDIGGVLLTNGWDHRARRRAATHFKMAWAEMEDWHHLTFETYEEGKLTLEEYCGRVVFYQKRPFTRVQFRRFMFAQSKPDAAMIELVRRLKAKYGLKIAVVSNEARELNSHRIRKFRLYEFVDLFISACFVHVRKPDADIFRLASTPVNQTKTAKTSANHVGSVPVFHSRRPPVPPLFPGHLRPLGAAPRSRAVSAHAAAGLPRQPLR